MLRILLADKQPITRAGMRCFLGDGFPEMTLGEVADASEVILAFETARWDLVIMDLEVILRDHRRSIDELLERFSPLSIVVASNFADSTWIRRCIPGCISGYLNKGWSSTEMIRVIQHILKNSTNLGYSNDRGGRCGVESTQSRNRSRWLLSTRECQLLHDLALGERLSETASRLEISFSAASTYRRRLMQKMGFKSNADITRFALSAGIV